MTNLPHHTLSLSAGSGIDPAQVITRLAAAGAGVHSHCRGDSRELVILNVPGARSCLTLTGTGCARWHYEPATGTATSAVTLTGIIVHILGAPQVAEHTPYRDRPRTLPGPGLLAEPSRSADASRTSDIVATNL